jgi:hypothetical protein
VLQLASLLWRLRRATLIETGLLQIESRLTFGAKCAIRSLRWRHSDGGRGVRAAGARKTVGSEQLAAPRTRFEETPHRANLLPLVVTGWISRPTRLPIVRSRRSLLCREMLDFGGKRLLPGGSF